MSNNDYLIVTSFNNNLYNIYAKKFIETFKSDFDLYVYSETDLTFTHNIKRLRKINIFNEMPNYKNFVKKHDNKPKDKFGALKDTIFKNDTVRFSYKVFSLIHAIENYKNYKYIVWIDADFVFRDKSFNHKLFDLFVEDDKFMSYMGREGNYSECGFLIFNTKNKYCLNYFRDIKELYLSEKIFKFNETHDSYIWDFIRKNYEKKYNDFNNINITEYSYELLKNKVKVSKNFFLSRVCGGEVLDRTFLFLFMCHQKGFKRKKSNIIIPADNMRIRSNNKMIKLEYDINIVS